MVFKATKLGIREFGDAPFTARGFWRAVYKNVRQQKDTTPQLVQVMDGVVLFARFNSGHSPTCCCDLLTSF